MWNIPSHRFAPLLVLCTLCSLLSGHHCHRCPEKCGDTVIPYPFGLTTCGMRTFQLQCNDQSQLILWLNNTDFRVLSVTSKTVVIDPTRGFVCGNSNIDFFSFIGEFSYAIPRSSYRISHKNALMMYKCDPHSSCGCDIQPGFDGAANLERAFGCPPRYCCGSLHNHSLLSLMKNCTSFVSFTLKTQPLEINKPVNIQVQYGLELEAWVPGPCACAFNAKCLLSEDHCSHQCECENGLVGDGFAMGYGCHANVSSCRRDSFVGCTRNVIILSVGKFLIWGLSTKASCTL